MDFLFIPFFVTFVVERFYPHPSEPPFKCCFFLWNVSTIVIWAHACLMLELEFSSLCLGAQQRCSLKDSSCWSLARSGADTNPSQSLAGGVSVTCQPRLTILMQHMDGGSRSVRQLLSALLLFITFDLLFEMKFFPLLFPIFAPLRLLSCN